MDKVGFYAEIVAVSSRDDEVVETRDDNRNAPDVDVAVPPEDDAADAISTFVAMRAQRVRIWYRASHFCWWVGIWKTMTD